MDSNPTKRRKTGHSSALSDPSTMTSGGFDAAASSAGLFRPSTFLLETAELLSQSKIDYNDDNDDDATFPGLNAVLRRLKTTVESVDSHGPEPIYKASSAFEKKNGITIPYPEPRPAKDSQLKLAMAKPTHCNVVGSYVGKTMVRSQPSSQRAVDMIVEMPSSLFQEKDYLNLRYFYKRAYYLAHLAKAVLHASLADNDDNTLEWTFAYFGGNPLLPILVASPGHKKYKIHVIPCCGDNVFSYKKLLASKNCLRGNSNSDSDSDIEKPTPFYNATVAAETAFLPYLKLLHQTHKTCTAFGDACRLGRMWLQQRGFGSAVTEGGFGAFEWSALVALLMQTGSSGSRNKSKSKSKSRAKPHKAILSPSLSSVQIFKAMMQFLSTADFCAKPFVLGSSTSTDEEPDTKTLRDDGGNPVLFDVGRHVNLGYKMSRWSAGLLQKYAQWTHDLLRQDETTTAADVDQFGPTFIAKANVALEVFDAVFRIRCPLEDRNKADKTDGPDRRSAVWSFGDKVFSTLTQAFGDRAQLVHVQLPRTHSWGLKEKEREKETKAKKENHDEYLIVGVVFDATNMARYQDQGPAAEDKQEAAQFRQFWGDKAELRRFKDGSIVETLVWESRSATSLCEEIARYILGRRLRIGDVDVAVVSSDSFEQVSFVSDSPEDDANRFAVARQMMASLENDLRNLKQEDLPLRPRLLAPISPALRSASLFPPPVGKDIAALYPMEVVLYLEGSSHWPDNLVAIQRSKMAFLLQIGQKLEDARSRTGDVTTRLGLESGGNGGGSAATDVVDADVEMGNVAFLDIVYSGRAAFRLRIYSDMEENLLRQRASPKNRATVDPHDRAVAVQLLAAERRLFAVRPRHSQTIATYATRFPALSSTIRLVKQWFGAQKLACHFSDEFLELLVLRLFLQPAPFQAPASAVSGFLRVLQFLARWDWKTEPLVVDTASSSNTTGVDGEPIYDPLSGTVSSTDDGNNSDPRTRLAAWRKIDPNMSRTVLFVSASFETSGTAFTTMPAPSGSRPLPPKMVAARMTRLAQAACRLVKQQDVSSLAAVSSSSSSPPNLDARLLFQPSLHEYDVVLHLSPRIVKRLIHGDIDEDQDEAELIQQQQQQQHHRQQKSRALFKNLDGHTGREVLSLPDHPVHELFAQLNNLYGTGSSGVAGGGGGSASIGPLVFFHGATEDDHDTIIAAMWNPQMQRRSFRINLPSSYAPVDQKKKKNKKKKRKQNDEGDNEDVDVDLDLSDDEEEALVELNRGAILAEIARIGGSLIERIEVHNV